jgi:hypothetical protein
VNQACGGEVRGLEISFLAQNLSECPLLLIRLFVPVHPMIAIVHVIVFVYSDDLDPIPQVDEPSENLHSFLGY